eukprot:TRINITY_DN3185_c0_g1_i3.p1 TRINITY_DN3185_c0_g1~~TRINITY_DN3185_c0_g1_i3.p1  ORF type:complete len:155 (+),score=60.37 TRINITY_DN3185_c0_g1_i3:206-670(+)
MRSEQEDVPRYKGLEDVRRLRERITDTLKWEIESNWRLEVLGQSTGWNDMAANELERVLEEMETCKWNNIPLTEDAQEAILESIARENDLVGYPINITYTDMEDIVQAVYDTKVWMNQDSNAEFAVGVYCVAYPNRVTSIWIYLAALIPKPFRF